MHAWATIVVTLALLVMLLRIVSHAIACNAWVTIDVALVLLVMLLHARLG